MIPGVQLGTLIQVDEESGEVLNVHTSARLVTPAGGCLLCNQAVSRTRIRDERISDEMRAGQRYVDGDDASAPSVVTLNSLRASQAANDFVFYMTRLSRDGAFQGTIQSRPLERRTRFLVPRRDQECPDCGTDRRAGAAEEMVLRFR